MSEQNGMNQKNKQRKRTGNSKSKRKVEFEKGKVYIPAYKMIIFCACVIAVCVTLLLISTLKAKDSPRYEKENTRVEKTKIENTDIKSEKAENNKTEKTQKQKSSSESVTIKPNQNKPDKTTVKEPEKKSEPKKSEPKKEETKKAEPVKTKPIEKIEEKEKPAQTSESVPRPQESVKIEKPVESKTETEPVNPSVPEKKSYNFPQAKNNAQLVFLFDDGGQNLNHLKPFLELPFPITVAVLPKLSHSVESAKRVRASGHELMLHQPMQAVNEKVNPGPGAIKPDMNESEIMTVLFQNINEIGPIAGFNNHEGSAITADAEKMEVIMKMASENGIFFLDSRTNKDTQVPYVAKEMGYSYYERNGYFLDNEKTKENALKELRRNLDIANKNGSVIMIGHIWSADFLPEFLQEVYPELKEKGYTFTTVSKSKGKKN